MHSQEKIEKIAASVCKAEGLNLIEIKVRGDAKNPVYEIYADNEAGITLGQCQKISRQIQDELDMDGDFEQNYRLDVSSPGLDRPLVFDWQFRKNIGKQLELALESGEKLQGVLKAVSEEGLEIQQSSKTASRQIRRAQIKQALIKLQW